MGGGTHSESVSAHKVQSKARFKATNVKVIGGAKNLQFGKYPSDHLKTDLDQEPTQRVPQIEVGVM